MPRELVITKSSYLYNDSGAPGDEVYRYIAYVSNRPEPTYYMLKGDVSPYIKGPSSGLSKLAEVLKKGNKAAIEKDFKNIFEGYSDDSNAFKLSSISDEEIPGLVDEFFVLTDSITVTGFEESATKTVAELAAREIGVEAREAKSLFDVLKQVARFIVEIV